MKKIFGFVCIGVLGILLNGCASSSPEYFEELNEKEHAALLHTARALALRSNAVPAHLHNAFIKLAPHERIVYDGSKHGKASFRWEIYEKRNQNNRLTQKDVNPYWVMAYAIGDLRDPAWKLTHANQDSAGSEAVTPARQMPARGRHIRQVRYKN